MFSIGSVCMKIAGRDSGKLCVIIDVLDNTYVLIDGNVRRKKCNVAHLEPVGNQVNIAKGASHDDVCTALGIPAIAKKSKQTPARKKQVRKGRKKKPAKTSAAQATQKPKLQTQRQL